MDAGRERKEHATESASSDGSRYSRDERDPVTTAAFTSTNRQRVGPRLVRGEVVYAMPLGIVPVAPTQRPWAKEFMLCSRAAGPDGRPERVPGQYGIYDSKPGDLNYRLIWRYHDVVVPRDNQPNPRRSEEDVRASGYPVQEANVYTN